MEDSVKQDDERQTGRIFGRREVASLLGAAGLAVPLVQALGSAPVCFVRPEQTEGPYFLDEKLNRSDIRLDPSDGSVAEGVPLELVLRVAELASRACDPLGGARVDVWHCDFRGFYSGVLDRGYDTRGKKFLRGCLATDPEGTARFRTVFPGWYPGRTVHIHFKIRTRSGGEFTSQLYFDDALTDEIHRRPPYAGRGARLLRNGDDFVYRNGGEQLLVALERMGDGYRGAFGVALRATS